MVLTQYFLGNYSFGVSWPEVTNAKTYSAQLDGGAEFFFRNHLNFFFTNISMNSSHTIVIRGYAENGITVLDSGTLTRTTLNVSSPDNLDPYIRFTSKITTSIVTGKEIDPKALPPLDSYDCIYANCNATVIYYNCSIDDIDEGDIYDPVDKKKGLTSEFLPLITAGSPKTRVMTQQMFEEDTGSTYVVPPGATNPFPITQTFYFALGFYYMDPSDSENPANLKCVKDSDGSAVLVTSLSPTEQYIRTTTKCKVIIPNTECTEHYMKAKDGNRYKFQRFE